MCFSCRPFYLWPYPVPLLCSKKGSWAKKPIIRSGDHPVISAFDFDRATFTLFSSVLKAYASYSNLLSDF